MANVTKASVAVKVHTPDLGQLQTRKESGAFLGRAVLATDPSLLSKGVEKCEAGAKEMLAGSVVMGAGAVFFMLDSLYRAVCPGEGPSSGHLFSREGVLGVTGGVMVAGCSILVNGGAMMAAGSRMMYNASQVPRIVKPEGFVIIDCEGFQDQDRKSDT